MYLQLRRVTAGFRVLPGRNKGKELCRNKNRRNKSDAISAKNLRGTG
jgi:hypothetical protein